MTLLYLFRDFLFLFHFTEPVQENILCVRLGALADNGGTNFPCISIFLLCSFPIEKLLRMVTRNQWKWSIIIQRKPPGKKAIRCSFVSAIQFAALTCNCVNNIFFFSVIEWEHHNRSSKCT